MSEPSVSIPASFKPLPLNLAVGLDRLLGYAGAERFVAFWWDSENDEAVWRDSAYLQPQKGDWQAFISMLAPIARHFNASFGAMEDPAKHVFLLDRGEHKAYLVEIAEAVVFLDEQ